LTSQGGFDLEVDLPQEAQILSATNVINSEMELEGDGGMGSTFTLYSALSIPALGVGTAFVNLTVFSLDQDVLPRNVFLNGSRCALALQSTASNVDLHCLRT
jgi:hypothetical protein